MLDGVGIGENGAVRNEDVVDVRRARVADDLAIGVILHDHDHDVRRRCGGLLGKSGERNDRRENDPGAARQMSEPQRMRHFHICDPRQRT